MEMTDANLDDIVSCLLTVDPYRIVLFGSLAAETGSSESDIDLLVILDSEAISQTYEERMKKKANSEEQYPRDQQADPY